MASKRPIWNKGRYSKDSLVSKDEQICISLKCNMRDEFVKRYYKGGGELFEPYFGHGIINTKVYSTYEFSRHHRCDTVIKSEGCYLGSCEEYIKQHDLRNVRVADFDHHGIPKGAVELFLTKNKPAELTLFATYGISCFSRQATVREITVKKSDSDTKKIRLHYAMRLLPIQYFRELYNELGYEILQEKTLQFQSLVIYYAAHIRQRHYSANRT